MNILITGAKGQVGSELVVEALKRGHKVHGFGSKALDISNTEQVNNTVKQIQPDVIINSAAYTAVDKAETEPAIAYAVNSQGSENLAKVCKQYEIPLLHISTDYVYDGEKQSAYTEVDTPVPTGVYGASKLEGDQKIAQIWHKHIILRVSWVFGQYGNNFVKTMLRLAEQRDELSIVNDQFGAPTSAKAISNRLLDIIDAEQFNQPSCPWGTYNLQSDPGVTWYDFAREIFTQAQQLEIINKKMKLNPIPSSQFPTPVKRPVNSKLDGQKLQQYFGQLPVDWKKDLSLMLNTIKQPTI
ncbi:MAG: dTDP-4-dehydrorhamnose reductase [gamma proteobacterium symbiont of Bathyaustriella thionipta]|nr:dTDP-4-dehydrorhamnose reductase [gamma proteobacterium symbiont of Bathyaustriella thionipta]MCU7949180.1 dTDP-4-dehydrorhamnose reductase [gamma proteobacterium symbiont of Bathyaustriella thionipta]MCU7954786.1 dTDP-4-dehydrorhamnose reductase [gamma proteobacterium symbiont of Bathyaustriella thionipta]MCU7956921.1 dTDP-4-dehydrorhamnose reductase [gamma proteobacterium symbiont of Bathyaustriella thionipta]MCU7966789.1 dTDP-4-dehydrorhamnose reductase [gamma proteobacterium symbiont of 